MKLTEAPAALSGQERAIYWIVAIVCGASRFLATARSLWEWDEALFCLGMRNYDVASHHPHPPGFPVYIAVAKIARVFTGSDFRALQSVNLIGGVLLFPAMFMLARELRLRFTTSVIAGALLAFFPNVWFFGGTGFSDVVTITMVIYAVAFLFRGCRDANAYFIGTFLLAVSVGIRPQNLLVGIFPAAIATWYRARESVRDVVFAALIGTAVIGVSYLSAIHATGSAGAYVNAIRVHGQYISRVDSYRSPDRPPLWRLIDRFFIKQYESPGLSIATSVFVLLSIVGAIRDRDRSMLFNAATFAPFAIAAWLMLDRYSVSRFSIGYAPMFAIFAADGIARISRRNDVQALLGAALIVGFIIYTWPALTIARTTIAPPVLGVDAVRQHLDPNRTELYVAFPMTPFIDYFLPNHPYHLVFDERALPLTVPTRPPYLLTEIDHTQPLGYVFSRDRGPLWNIARRHYFEVALEPLPQLPQFVSGWYPPEEKGAEELRWMGGRSVTVLPRSSGTTKLRIQFDVPDELMASPPAITFVLNGAVIDRFKPAESHLVREYEVTPGPAQNTLEITTDRTLLHSSIDRRDLGLLVRFLSWGREEP
ncbi:MAG TPA: hypothetical protein VF975_09255 [Thermoanaerobaculia bacterium]